MITHLPRPARATTIIVARTMRRLKKGAALVEQGKAKRPKPRTPQAFNALNDRTAPMVLAAATPSSD